MRREEKRRWLRERGVEKRGKRVERGVEWGREKKWKG